MRRVPYRQSVERSGTGLQIVRRGLFRQRRAHLVRTLCARDRGER